MMRVSNTTAHGITSPLPRVRTRQFATAEKGRSAVARFLVIMLSLFPMFAVFATNANPASADLGIPTWAKFNLPASVARTAGSVGNTVISVAEALPDIAGAAPLSAAEAATLAEIAAAGTATGAAAITCPAWCVAAAVGIGATGLGYGLYKFATMDGPTCKSQPSACPNADVPASAPGPPSVGPGGTATVAWLNSSFNVNITEQVLTSGGNQYTALAFNTTPSGHEGSVDQFNAAYMAYLEPGHVVVGRIANGYPTPLEFSSDAASHGYTYWSVRRDWSQTQYAVSYATATVAYFALPGYTPGVGGVPAQAQGTPAGADIPRVPIETRICKDTAGNATTVTATGNTYTEGSGIALVKHAGCPAGTVTDSATVISHAPNGEVPDKQLSTITRPSTVPVGTTPTPIRLVVILPDGSTQTCEQSPSPCANWYDSPTKNDTFQCMQGATVLALSECDGLQKRYNVPVSPVIPSDGQDKSCWSGFSFNPVSWVITPLKCLFIPKGDAMGRWQTQISTIQNSGVFALFTTFGNFVGTVATAGKTATACPTEATGTFNNGTSVVNKSSPIHWCDIIVNAGNQTQSSSWGMVIYNGARIMMFIWFGIYWYNRITASAGGQSAL